MASRTVVPAGGPVDAEFTAPPSKSVTHRALIAAALASGQSTLLGPLDADDTRATRDGLTALGLRIETARGSWTVHGGGGEVAGGGPLHLGMSGTSLRFLLVVAALGHRPSLLDGAPRLGRRPIEGLVRALRELGGRVATPRDHGNLPLKAGGASLRGGSVRVEADRTSQFASALLLIGPCLRGGLEVRLECPAVSLPYVRLTASVMRRFGARVRERPGPRWLVAPVPMQGREFRVDGDHSSASYFLAAAAICGGRVRIRGLDPDSPQPDARFAGILERLGCAVQRGKDWVEVTAVGRVPAFALDLGDAPDLVPTLAVVALFADGRCALRGVAHLRGKESDRLEALAANLTSLGCSVRTSGDGMTIGPPPEGPKAGQVRAFRDHRVAMAFGIAGLRIPGIRVDNPACVRKSYPRFWDELSVLEGHAASSRTTDV